MIHLETIRAACAVANDDIMKLQFGCEVEIYGVKQKIISYNRNNWRLTTNKSDCEMNASELKEKVTILGRPIRLADVLLAINAQRKRDGSRFWVECHGAIWKGNIMQHTAEKVADYNLLKDDLSLQTPETQEFIADLLK